MVHTTAAAILRHNVLHVRALAWGAPIFTLLRYKLPHPSLKCVSLSLRGIQVSLLRMRSTKISAYQEHCQRLSSEKDDYSSITNLVVNPKKQSQPISQ